MASMFALVGLRLRGMTVLQWLVTLSFAVFVMTGSTFGLLLANEKSVREAAKATAPFATALVGLITLVVTVTNLIANWRRQKKQATIEAYSKWSDSTVESRRSLTTVLTKFAISEELGRALAADEAYDDGTINLGDKDSRKAIMSDLAAVLNGLERLSVGVKTGVYDLQTLRLLGGTIIVREWERCESYVLARRTLADVPRRQERAYVWLEIVANEIESLRLRDNRLDMDRNRVRSLRQNR